MKTHTLENVSYGASGRRWKFEAPGYSFATPLMPGGRATAEKIARQLNGGSKRMKGNGMDSTSRTNVARILHDAAKAQTKVIPHVGFTCGQCVNHGH